MAKPTTKPSDRGRNTPEGGPPPGSRAGQRSTVEQLEEGQVSDDPALQFERDEQERLPPRGTGAQQNQGRDHGPTVASSGKREPTTDVPVGDDDGLQSGGTRGPSNAP